ncbi:hypothetical protein K1719_033943 [Acacia pycnantha]|nr:hypothetical protein K1719_033943 [Acacia pycnantha]
MKLLAIAILLSTLLVQEATFVLGDVGSANSYEPPYIPTACDGSNRGQFPPGNLFAVVSEGLVDVKVVDLCKSSPCPNTILLSKTAFPVISRFPKADIDIEYVQI